MASWPSLQQFQDCMPIMWSDDFWIKDMVSLLPPAIQSRSLCHGATFQKADSSDLLWFQKKKMLKDWEVVSQAMSNCLFDDFVYTWLIVNTRSFYHDLSGLSSRAARSADDCMVLCPVVDTLNHQDRGVSVSFDHAGFTVTVGQSEMPAGQTQICRDPNREVFASYGPHSNDFLLVECMLRKFA